MPGWMIYGANGYTGQLIAREAVRRGLAPILGGRNRSSIEPLAAGLGLPWRIFGLEDGTALPAQLHDVEAVLHCAGPFSATSAAMIEACLASATHYLDITGEISVFEHAFAQHQRARQAGIVLCPGVGFDVLPTDCVAARLKDALPDATHLALGFDTRSGFSPGTARTSVEGMAQGGKMRRNGSIVTTALAASVRTIDFGAGAKLAMSVPWGDVSTAWHSTGIDNIEVYIPASARMIKATRRANLIRPLLGLRPVQRFLKHRAGQTRGPDADTRTATPTWVWGEARNGAGQIRTARIHTANGYTVTTHGALAVIQHLLAGTTPGGSYTPSTLCGSDLIERLPGSGKIALA